MKKVTKLEKVYEDIEMSFGKVPEDKMQETINTLKKEINGRRDSLEKMQGAETNKRAELAKSIRALEVRMNNLEGYSKNRTQITKIRNYKATIEQRLEQAIHQKEKCDSEIERNVPILKKLTEQLNDKKYMQSLNISQLSRIKEQRNLVEQTIQENQKNSKQLKARIMELQAKIGKCDLAWKTLFTNKGWDEIQRRTVENKNFTRKIDEKNPPVSSKKKDGKQQEEQAFDENTVRQQVGSFVNRVKEEENNLPVPISRWDKIKNFFKQIPTKLKEKFKKEQPSETQQQDKQPVRDEFVESLRQYVDEDYRKQVRQEKEHQYMEKHEIKPKKEKTEDKER